MKDTDRLATRQWLALARSAAGASAGSPTGFLCSPRARSSGAGRAPPAIVCARQSLLARGLRKALKQRQIGRAGPLEETPLGRLLHLRFAVRQNVPDVQAQRPEVAADEVEAVALQRLHSPVERAASPRRAGTDACTGRLSANAAQLRADASRETAAARETRASQ